MNQLLLSALQFMGAEDLAGYGLAALKEQKYQEAVRFALQFARLGGFLNPEAYAFCAYALDKAGYHEAALNYWDKALLRNRPQNAGWLEKALHTAWQCSTDAAQDYVKTWLTLLDNSFSIIPPVSLLTELSARQWTGLGSAGIQRGYLRAWLWLPLNKQYKVSISGQAPDVRLNVQCRATTKTHSLCTLEAKLPDSPEIYQISIASEDGQPLCGSPVVCSASNSARYTKALPGVNLKNSQVTIIVPCYDDRQATLSCLASVWASLKKCKTRTSVLVVWDCGPDMLLLEKLRRLSARHKIILLENASNLGFLASVNRALSTIRDGDVILLNADTLVHGDWVDRLVQAGRTQDVATVTALGSDAELVSFPSPFFYRNKERGQIAGHAPIHTLAQTKRIDQACAGLSPKEALHEIPVGVGFCMLLTRRALKTLGGLNGLDLFRGYGEEVEFCLRAREFNLKNYAALNVFVAHLGGRSFGASKRALAEQNNQVIFKRYPLYDSEYNLFVVRDALRPVREKIALQVCSQFQAAEVHVYPWSMRYLPLIDDLEQEAFLQQRTLLNLFVLPCGAKTRVLFCTQRDIPLPDLHFTLPDDQDVLQTLFHRCGCKTLVVQAFCQGLASVAKLLGLALFYAPDYQEQSPLPSLPVTLTEGCLIVAPPQTLQGWRKLNEFAQKHPKVSFMLFKRFYFWGNCVRAGNILDLPIFEEEDLTYLQAQAFILADANKRTILASWQKWLEKCGLKDLPMHTLPAEQL